MFQVIPENQVQQDVEDGLEEQSEQETIDRGLWYIVQCFTGHEYKVQQHIQLLVDDPRYKDYLYRVLVPFEETVEIKNNKRVEKTVRMYPGYVFVCW